MSGYWPSWAGALGLGAVTVAFPLVLGRRLGISGAWERVLHWTSERDAERADAVLDDADAFAAALAAETSAQFGAASVDGGGGSGGSATVTAPPASAGPIERRLPLNSQLVLLVSVLVGGFLAAVVSGRFEIRTDMGAAFDVLVTDGPWMWVVLFVGGLLVGVGTRMAGGCSSGHGLSGCSRLEPESLVATAVFFAAAVATSFMIWKVW